MTNKLWGLDASVLIDTGSPINAGCRVSTKRRGFEVCVLMNASAFIRSFTVLMCIGNKRIIIVISYKH